jgi:DNA-binding Lrp family transcriptional regulator
MSNVSKVNEKILKLATKHNGMLTAVEIAGRVGVSVEHARMVLRKADAPRCRQGRVADVKLIAKIHKADPKHEIPASQIAAKLGLASGRVLYWRKKMREAGFPKKAWLKVYPFSVM